MTFNDVLEIKNGRNQKAVENPNGRYPIYGSGGIIGRADDYICDAQTVVIGRKGSINNPIFVEEPFWNVDTAFGLTAKKGILNPRYLYFFCKNYDFEKLNKTVTIPSLTKEDLLKIDIDLPSLDDQSSIVQKLLAAQEIIRLRSAELIFLDNLIKARFVEMFGDPRFNTKGAPVVCLGDLGRWCSGGTPSRSNPEYFKGDINWYSAGELNTLFLNGSNEKITKQAIDNSAAKLLKAGTMLIGMYDTAAFKMGILKEESASNQACACLEPNDKVDIVWLYYELQLMKDYFLSHRRGVRQKNLNLGMIKGFEVPIATLPDQKAFTVFVEQTNKSKVVAQKALDKTQHLFDSLMQKYFG